MHLALLSNSDKKNQHYISPDQILPKKGIIDEWIYYPTSLGKAVATVALFRLLLDIRQKNFDTLIYLMPRIRSEKQINRDISFFRLAGIRNFIGVSYLRRTRLSSAIPSPSPPVETEWRHLLQCLQSDGVQVDQKHLKPDLLLNDGEIARARSWFDKSVGSDIRGLTPVAIAPGSKWDSKIWPEDRFTTVVSRLIRDDHIFPIIFGGVEDQSKGERMIANWGRGVNSAGQLNVRESAALLAECKLYLGNDTGSMHLAAAVGVPCVAIFAAIDWRGRWLPFGDNNAIFRQNVECEGCHTPDCFNKHKCLLLTEVDEVYQACARILTSN